MKLFHARGVKALLTGLAVAAGVAAAVPAEAQQRPRHRSEPREVWVTAESRYNHGSVSGPVREGRRGQLQVRSPAGNWYDCARSCSETLRRETVDFWEAHSPYYTDGPGYFQWSWSR